MLRLVDCWLFVLALCIRSNAQNRVQYVANEKGSYVAAQRHYASLRPIVHFMLSDKLNLATLSNTKFYKKLVPEITCAYNSSQNKGGVNTRYWQQVVGSRRDSNNLTWSAPAVETACERPYCNMAPLFPHSEQVLRHRINRCHRCPRRCAFPLLVAAEARCHRVCPR